MLPSEADRPAGATPCRLFARCAQEDKATVAAQTNNRRRPKHRLLSRRPAKVRGA
jgi:hypothetical protein